MNRRSGEWGGGGGGGGVGGRAQARVLSTASNHTPPSERPFRLAVIGSGPAGFYSAYRAMHKVPESVVDMYEQLPVPYGLVRFGVAPDHPDVKNCQAKFEEVADSPRFNFIGNIAVGSALPLTALRPHYDAILFAYGASKDKALDIPGEALSGVLSARAFVGWYNGLPEYASLDPALAAGEDAVIIGQGNVALDVARILLADLAVLRKTDITETALEALSKSRVRRVQVVGRRGPLQAAFTIKEVRELMNLPSVAFAPIDPALFPADAATLPRQQRRITQVLQKGSSTPSSAALKSWALRFLLSPSAFRASSPSSTQLSSVDFTHTAFAPDSSPFDRSASVTAADPALTTSLPAALAFRSVGYKSAPLPGLADLGVPFDSALGTIPNDGYGRVLSASLGPGGALTAGHVPGCYCAGWVKRGPTGVIASTMEDAFASADVVAADWGAAVPFLNGSAADPKRCAEATGLGWEGVKAEAERRRLRRVSWAEWKVIDEWEIEEGRRRGKEREKVRSVEEMLRILDGGGSGGGGAV
ncbi:hypothetical protein LTR04_000532 [Oleoguttula sp. CCFEE 6159]|nr:hypothetical protein LTR04_000532 [Oleoguttula sp. CCFEE 6159]